MVPVPFNEQLRLAVLDGLNVLDGEPDERFDRITRLATRCFDVPIAVISLVGTAHQWFMSSTGLDVAGTDRDVSFCGHAIMSGDVLVVLDAAANPRFADNPLVTGEPGIRFYAGAPLVTEKGFRLGTLCLIDRKPRDAFGAADRATLSDLAMMVMEEMYRGCAQSGMAGHGAPEGTPDPARGSPASESFRRFERSQAQEAQLLFIASLSHELRTPLNAIIGFSEVLQRELFGPIDNARYLEYAQHINASGAHLSQFVDSVLDYVKAERGEVCPHDDWIDLCESVHSCRNMFVEQLRGGDLQFLWKAPEDLPLLKADPQLVLQMLVNLVGNSIKFTPSDGQIHVAAGLEPDGGLTVSVSDTGVGIAEEDLRICLVPFGQARNPMMPDRRGTGLGLSLTRRFVELHDGALSIESRPGVGTTVRLHFPAYRVE